MAIVLGTAHAQGQRQRRFAFQGEIGQYVLHQRLLQQDPAANLAVRAMVHGLGQGLTHQRAGADHAVETGRGDHLDDGRHAAPFLTDHPGQRAAVLDFAGGVGPVAQLVFQALDVELVARAIRAMAGQQEAGQALVGLRQGEEGIAHRRRTEPLVPDQLVGLPGATGTNRIGACAVGAHVGTALLLGHRHTDGDAGLLLHRQVARVIFAGKDLRQPALGEIRLQAQGGHAGVGHGQRAAAAGLGLVVQVHQGGTRHLRTGLRVAPGQRRNTVLDGAAHQLVIGRVKLHQVDAMAVAVMTLEHRPVLVGEKAGLHQRPTGKRAVDVQPRLRPAGMITLYPPLQRQIDAIEIGTVEWRNLVGDLMDFGATLQIHLGVLLRYRRSCQQA